MGSFRNTMAAMLMTLTFVAFQSDAYAQAPRGESRTATRSSRQAGSSSNVNKSTASRSSANVSRSSSQTRQSATRPSSGSVNRSSSQNRPSGNLGSPSGQNRPTVTRPSTSDRKPSNTVNRPSSQTRPSGNVNSRPSGSADRPSGQTRPSGNLGRPSDSRQDFKPGNRNNKPVNVTRPGRLTDRPSSRPGVRPADRPGVRPAIRPDRPVQIRPNHRYDRPRVHPRDRDFMTWNKPSYFWTGYNHYYGHRVRVLPSNVLRRMYRGITYYCYNDIWYRPYGGYYVVCRPPYGTSLAANLIADMTWAAVKLSYYNTVTNTYRQLNDNNRYIAEQNEIIAQNNALIASQNAMIAQNQQAAQAAYTLANELGLVQSFASADSEYFYQDGVFYSKDSKGEYQVIVPPAGALVEALPEDYDMVTLNGEEYYKVDDTVFKVTLSEGKPYFEVLGQMIA